jgi:hypothetical protein
MHAYYVAGVQKVREYVVLEISIKRINEYDISMTI